MTDPVSFEVLECCETAIAALDLALSGETDHEHPKEIFLPFESLERAAAELMRLGPAAVALEPPELREIIARRAEIAVPNWMTDFRQLAESDHRILHRTPHRTSSVSIQFWRTTSW